jgi:hypothetical protein
MHTMNHAWRGFAPAALALSALTLLAGCGKVSEIASERATEKMIEAQMNQGGGSAKVDLSKGGVTAEGTDEQGRAYKMEMGSAQLGEKDIGLPFYPGAKPLENSGTRIRNGESHMMSLELHAGAGPKEVAAWYREQMKPRGEGAMVVDSARDDGGLQLSIIDGKRKENVNVEVAADGDGSRITLVHAVGQ